MAQPTISSIVPASGAAAGGTSILITGTGFTGATAVNFGTVVAASFSVISDTQVTATSPAGTGTVNVSVTTAGGTSAAVAGSVFAYSPAATPQWDPALTNQFAQGLLNMLQTATSPDAVEAQSIILRRMALEGDVVPSRLLAPRNITETGGVLNLLTDLNQPEMRDQALAGLAGVAGPNPPMGWEPSHPLAFVAVTNDRPAGPAQRVIPLVFFVRSDFVIAMQAALTFIRQRGATLPVAGTPAMQLPVAAPGATQPTDALPFLGRTLDLVTAAALNAPATDPLLLGRVSGTTNPLSIFANVLSAGTVAVTPANYDVTACNATSCSTVTLTGQSLVDVAPPLAQAGFYPATPIPQPANANDSAWAHFTNVTGLYAGTTKLGDELALLYDTNEIANSVFAGSLDWVWNGTTFVSPS
jgi:hypothetical protein